MNVKQKKVNTNTLLKIAGTYSFEVEFFQQLIQLQENNSKCTHFKQIQLHLFLSPYHYKIKVPIDQIIIYISIARLGWVAHLRLELWIAHTSRQISKQLLHTRI